MPLKRKYGNLGSYWLEIIMFYVMSRVWTHCEWGQGCAARVFVLFARAKRVNWGLTRTKITMVYKWYDKIWWEYRRYYTKLLQMTSITFCLLTLVYISNLSPPLHWRGGESLPPFRRTHHTHTLLQVVTCGATGSEGSQISKFATCKFQRWPPGFRSTLLPILIKNVFTSDSSQKKKRTRSRTHDSWHEERAQP